MMKKYIYAVLVILIAGIFVSCVEDTAPEDEYGDSPNLFSFVNSVESFGISASGEEFTRTVSMLVKGPSLSSLSGDIVATISVDESKTTAIEGVHYRLDETTITLSKDQNYIADFPVTVLTDGIEPPLDESPVLSLLVVAVDGNGVVANGKTNDVSINYLCSSDLAGSYNLVVIRDGASLVYDGAETLDELGDGIYRGLQVGHWGSEGLGYTPGFTFYDVCDVITVPDQDLVDFYSNQVRQAGPSSVDPVTGVITIHYGIYSDWESEYVATYTPN